MDIKQTKILLVDDDVISLKVLVNYLQETDYNYLTATDGLKAWELLINNPAEFSLVIADRVMPHLHGSDLLKKMQTHPQLKSIPFIMLTGEAEKEDMLDAVKAGVEDFLFKPIEKALFLSVLRRILL